MTAEENDRQPGVFVSVVGEDYSGGTDSHGDRYGK